MSFFADAAQKIAKFLGTRSSVFKKETKAKEFLEKQEEKKGKVTALDRFLAQSPELATGVGGKVISEALVKPFARAAASVVSQISGKRVPPSPFTETLFGTGIAGEEAGEVLPLSEQRKRIEAGKGFGGQAAKFVEKRTGIKSRVTAAPLVLLITAGDLFPENPFKSKGLLQAIEKINDVSKLSLKARLVAKKLLKGEQVKVPPEIINEIQKVAESIIPLKDRGLIKSVRKSGLFEKEVKETVAGKYKPITNVETVRQARKIIDSNFDRALTIVKTSKPSALNFEISRQLILKLQDLGRFEEATGLVEIIAKKATQQGQAIQALSLWSRLQPEGVIRYAQRIINRVNESAKIPVKLTEEDSKKLVGLAKEIRKFPEGSREHAVSVGRLLSAYADLVPPTLGRKIATIQTIAQLLNPKTAIRNFIGNTAFNIIENVSDIVGTAVDAPISLITGKRTKALPSISAQAEGLTYGTKVGFQDVIEGIDTTTAKQKYEIPTTKVLRSKVGQLLEKSLGIILRVPDRAFYEASFQGSLEMQMRLAKVKEPTEQMLETAHFDGLYRTFQDENTLTKFFVGFKRLLNAGKDFGLGDFIIKYPRTPANLLARGIDYSPLGFVKSVFELTAPLVGGPMRKFDQKKFVESFSRALIGTTGLVGTGAILNKLGILSLDKEGENERIKAVNRVIGLDKYQINVTALKRFVLSGLNAKEAKRKDGDKLISFDWFQPMAISLAFGADLNQNKGKHTGFVGSIIDGTTTGFGAFEETPVVSGVKRVFSGKGNIAENLAETLVGVPSSFVPTLLNQVRQLADNTNRNTFNPDPLIEAMNKVKNRIPGFSKLLPAYIDAFGKEKELYQKGTNNPYRVFISPAFHKEVLDDPEAKFVLDLYERTGEAEIAPEVVDRNTQMFGHSFTLTAEEMEKSQKAIGLSMRSVLSRLATDPTFLASSSLEQVAILKKVSRQVSQLARLPSYLRSLGIEEPSRLNSEETIQLLSKLTSTPGFSQLSKEKQKEVIRKVFERL